MATGFEVSRQPIRSPCFHHIVQELVLHGVWKGA